MGTATTIRPPREAMTTISSEGWHAVLKSVDPLSEWRSEFAEWRREIDTFRVFESKAFFLDRDNEVMRRAHRGWLCQTISMGEMLAVELLKDDKKKSAEDEFKFLNLLLENLQQTLETWHSAAGMDLKKKESAV